MRVGLSVLIVLAGLLSPFAADVATQTPGQPTQVAAQQPFEEWLGARKASPVVEGTPAE